jgi:5-methylcytosine-specific restriction endonuclease McrA
MPGMREKFGVSDRPRRCRIALMNGRHIPAAVRRAVALRDGWPCAFIGKGGHRCEARRRLEFHHLVPYEVGGASTVENIQLRCRAHNQYEADLFFAASRIGRAALPIEATLPIGQAELVTRPGPSRADQPTSHAPA